MAIFDYTTALPQFKSPITSQRLRTLYSDIKTHFNTFNPQGWTFPNTPASQYQTLLFGTGSAFTLGHVFRSDGAVSFTGAGSLTTGDLIYYNGTNLTRIPDTFAQGDILYFNGTRFTRIPDTFAQGDILYFNGTRFTKLAKGTTGQVLRAGASAPEYTTLAVASAWTAQTGNFSIADKGRYQVNGSQTGTLFVANSIENEFWIKPAIGQNFETNNFTIARAGSETIANAAENFVCDINAEYHFVANAAGNWDVSVSPIGRS
jgi:hypothetical protein